MPSRSSNKGLIYELEEPIEIEGDIDTDEDVREEDDYAYVLTKTSPKPSIITTNEQIAPMNYYNGNSKPLEGEKFCTSFTPNIQNSHKLFINNNTDVFNLKLHDSDQGSKASTSKTPCFIETPSNSSQINSLSGTKCGLFKANSGSKEAMGMSCKGNKMLNPQDLIIAMNNSKEKQGTKQLLSSEKSSVENFQRKFQKTLSFGDK